MAKKIEISIKKTKVETNYKQRANKRESRTTKKESEKYRWSFVHFSLNLYGQEISNSVPILAL